MNFTKRTILKMLHTLFSDKLILSKKSDVIPNSRCVSMKINFILTATKITQRKRPLNYKEVLNKLRIEVFKEL
jgi:hypothetical protein